MIAMIGTSDRLCWLAETCKILLLLLLLCDNVFMIQALYQALQISAITGNCICEGNSRRVLQLQL